MDKNKNLLYITKKVEEKYRNKVRDNSELSLLEIRKKLTRNFLCGEISYEGNKYIIVYYGLLKIVVMKKRNLIINIKNCKRKTKISNIDDRKVKYINCLFGIEGGKNNE